MSGSVQAGIGQAQTDFDKVVGAGFPMVIGAFSAILAELLVELDRVDDAERVVAALDPEVDETVAERAPRRQLAAGGLSNREIAETLWVTQRPSRCT